MSKVDYELLYEKKPKDIDKLFKIYQEDPKKARVVFLNGEKSKFQKVRLVIFKRGKDFEICKMATSYGISITNRIYSSDKKLGSIIYKSNKFYITNNEKRSKTITQLTFGSLDVFASGWSVGSNNWVMDYLFERFSWMRFIQEYQILQSTAFNVFITHKLYNYKSAIQHLFKIPYPSANRWIDGYVNNTSHHYTNSALIKKFKGDRQQLTNIENLQTWMIRHHFYEDTLRMGKMLGEKINCSWSQKRLISEHDKWSIRVGIILAECEELEYLKVKKVYFDFGKLIGYEPLSTNHALLREGAVQHHCVGSYSNNVNSGASGIFHIKGFTLDVGFVAEWDYIKHEKKLPKLKINQFRGLRNISAPNELEQFIKDKINEFNETDLSQYHDVVDELSSNEIF
jgi:hypothetical protein